MEQNRSSAWFQRHVVAPMHAQAQQAVRDFLFQSMEWKESAEAMTEADWEDVCEIECILWGTLQELSAIYKPGLLRNPTPPAQP